MEEGLRAGMFPIGAKPAKSARKAHGDAPEHEHVMVAIKDAFAAAQRQIKDAAREMRG